MFTRTDMMYLLYPRNKYYLELGEVLRRKTYKKCEPDALFQDELYLSFGQRGGVLQHVHDDWKKFVHPLPHLETTHLTVPEHKTDYDIMPVLICSPVSALRLQKSLKGIITFYITKRDP